MSHSFDPYEYVAVIAPGSVVALGLAAEWPAAKSFIAAGGFTVGDLGIALLCSFVLGHLAQAIGNALEAILWWPFGGMPSLWIIRPTTFLSEEQRCRVALRLNQLHDEPIKLHDMSRSDLKKLVPQIFSQVRAAGRSERIDIWSRNYGLLRGIAAAFVVLAAWLAIKHGPNFGPSGMALVAAAIAWSRAARFACYYARDLYIEWIGLPSLSV